MSKNIATTVQERLEMDSSGQAGDIQDDLAEFGGNMQDMMDYFGDEDPVLYL